MVAVSDFGVVISLSSFFRWVIPHGLHQEITITLFAYETRAIHLVVHDEVRHRVPPTVSSILFNLRCSSRLQVTAVAWAGLMQRYSAHLVPVSVRQIRSLT